MSYVTKIKKLEGSAKKYIGSELKEETVEEVLTYPFRENKERGISKVTCEKFGVRASVSEKDGKTITAYYFPSMDSKGKITGFMKQDLTKHKKEDFYWTAVGYVGIENKLFGQDLAENVKRKKTRIVVTEGQWDALAVYQSCRESVKNNEKYKELEPFVVSIPLGTMNSAEAMLHNKDFILSFPEMNIFFDDDQATPKQREKGVMKGVEARDAVAAAFIGDIKLLCTPLIHGFKDASDFLQSVGDGKKFKTLSEAMSVLAKQVSFEHRTLQTEKIAHVSDISFESIIKPLELGVQVDCFPLLNEMLGGFRKRELTIVTASSGAGKTTALSRINDDIIAQGYNSGLIYLEEPKEKTLQRLIASRLCVSYKEYKRDPLSVAKEEDIRNIYEELKAANNVIFIDHFGSMPIAELMAKIKHLHYVEGCDYILLDHLSMVISGSDVKDERKELDIVMTELAAFCASNDVGILLVVHLNRQGSAVHAPKGKEEEPFWSRIDLSSLRGSGGLEQLSWNVLSLEREYLPSRKRGRVRWAILKNREFGELGIADVFSLNPVDWSIQLYENANTDADNVAVVVGQSNF